MTERAPGRQREPAGRRQVVRLVDIATAVGVHPSTVSRVLNGEVGHSLRPETVERILAEARARGYRPNALARALRQHRTGALTFVVPMLRNPIWVRLQRGALLRAAERGYVVMIMEEPMEDPKPPGAYSYLISESRADGLLLATALRGGRGADLEPDKALSAVPHVYVNRRGPDQGNDVVMDEAGAIRLFLDHVAGLGHRSVLLIDGRREVDTVHRRAAATRRHCAALGLTAVIRHADATEAGGYAVIRRLLAAGPLPTAIGIGSIEQVYGVLAALRDARIAVPGAVSLVSLDEDESLAYLDVPVTSICMPLAELGAAAVDALIARIDGTGGSDVLIGEPMYLVSRGSVGPPPQRAERLNMSLAGRVAVVTGGAHGIGAAIADALAADGAKVHRVDKQPTALDGSALTTADLTDSSAVNDVFTAVGPVDILVNTAGGVVGQVGHPLEEVSVEAWQAVVNANLTTMFLCTRAAVPAMKERGWGRIINISSGAGLTVSKTGIQAYASAKAGQLGFTRQMAHELGPYGITVNCIAPGFILSNPTTQRQWDGYGPDGQRALVDGIAMRRIGQPADIANGVSFFASARSGWVTGQIIAIDGGSAFL